jgi:hypothetical protein
MKTKRRIVRDNYLKRYFVQYRWCFMWFDYTYLRMGDAKYVIRMYYDYEDAKRFLMDKEAEDYEKRTRSLPERFTII